MLCGGEERQRQRASERETKREEERKRERDREIELRWGVVLGGRGKGGGVLQCRWDGFGEGRTDGRTYLSLDLWSNRKLFDHSVKR